MKKEATKEKGLAGENLSPGTSSVTIDLSPPFCHDPYSDDDLDTSSPPVGKPIGAIPKEELRSWLEKVVIDQSPAILKDMTLLESTFTERFANKDFSVLRDLLTSKLSTFNHLEPRPKFEKI